MLFLDLNHFLISIDITFFELSPNLITSHPQSVSHSFWSLLISLSLPAPHTKNYVELSLSSANSKSLPSRQVNQQKCIQCKLFASQSIFNIFNVDALAPPSLDSTVVTNLGESSTSDLNLQIALQKGT